LNVEGVPIYKPTLQLQSGNNMEKYTQNYSLVPVTTEHDNRSYNLPVFDSEKTHYSETAV
jgi:hypothetical protein